MCFPKQPKVEPLPPPPAPPPPPLPLASKAVTSKQAKKEQRSRTRGTAQLTIRRPSVSMGGSGGVGVQMTS